MNYYQKVLAVQNKGQRLEKYIFVSQYDMK